jgi:hypothetical protein
VAAGTKLRIWGLAFSLVGFLSGVGSAETLTDRGSYLVNTIGACGNCHTARDAAGKLKADIELAGGFEFDDAKIGHIVMPNIAPDPETGISKHQGRNM